jgi:magnesium-transporting ATPase (P-type)
MFLDVLINIGLGLLGLSLFTVWSVREHLREFSWSILFKKNIPFWIWSLTMLLLIAALVAFSPDAAGAIKTMTGLDISEEPAAFVALGMGLGRISRDIQTNSKHKKSSKE